MKKEYLQPKAEANVFLCDAILVSEFTDENELPLIDFDKYGFSGDFNKYR